MYNSDLNIITKARLQETQDVARAQPPVKHHLPKWVKRAARQLAQQLHLH